MIETDVPNRCVSVVGLIGGEWFGRRAGHALASATVLTGDRRHLDRLPERFRADRRPASGSVHAWLDQIERWDSEGEAVCAVVSGDPGFFGIVRILAPRFPVRLNVHPAPSSVSMAFARAGLSWDDTVVVSAHGRPLEHASAAIASRPKVAVLCSPDNPPQAVAEALLSGRCGPRRVIVSSRIGETDERTWEGDLESLVNERFDGLSVLVAVAPEADSREAGIEWGLPEEQFEHRDRMVTKSEVRAVALGKLGIPAVGVLWDVGAGSGSVAFECAALAPGLRVFAIERRDDDVDRLRHNVEGTGVEVVHGEAPGVFAALPDPDRVFIGGGGSEVLDAVMKRLKPGGRVVATFASFGRAASAAERLGRVVQVSIARGVPSGSDGSFRLEAENPVFVCWGPS